MTVLIHGRAGDEQLEITVQNGAVSITPTDKTPDVELDHIPAMHYFFSPICYARDTAPAVAQSWFPAPLWSYSTDAV